MIRRNKLSFHSHSLVEKHNLHHLCSHHKTRSRYIHKGVSVEAISKSYGQVWYSKHPHSNSSLVFKTPHTLFYYLSLPSYLFMLRFYVLSIYRKYIRFSLGGTYSKFSHKKLLEVSKHSPKDCSKDRLSEMTVH